MKKKNRWSRSKPAGMQWFSSAAALPADWDEVLPPGHYLRRATLAVHEGAGLERVAPLYLRIEQDGTVLLQAAFQLLNVHRSHADDSGWGGLQRTAWRAYLAIGKPRLLVAGHLFRHDITSLWYDAERLPAYEAFRHYHAAIREALRRSCATAALVKDVPAALVDLFQNLAPEFLLLRNDISMRMDIPGTWAAIGDYEKALKHKYAQRFRKTRQGWQGLTVRELDAAETAAQGDVLYGLYRQVTDRQPVRLGLLSPDFLPVLKAHYGDDLRIWLIEEGGNPVAFASAWVYGSRLDMFYIGFDSVRNGALSLYFNILFFSVEAALALGKSEVILGRTALEAKARVGCRPDYLHTFLYIRSGWLRRLVAGLQQRSFSGEGEWESRHPFKPAAPAA